MEDQPSRLGDHGRYSDFGHHPRNMTGHAQIIGVTMRGEVSKSDWKHFKAVREIALDRLCVRILDDIRKTATDETATPHERFLAVYELVNESNEDVARGFDFLSRSRMIQHLLAMQSMNVVNQDELMGFSGYVREQLAVLARIL